MKVAIIGKGNVGSHLARAFQISERCPDMSVRLFGARALENEYDALVDYNPDVALICVKDDKIADIAALIAPYASTHSSITVAHTSGSVPIDVLDALRCRKGVFYPMQTFSRDVEMQYSDIPVYIECREEEGLRLLETLARTFTETVRPADSFVRRKLHVAAVLSCNFVNHLWALADDWLTVNGMTFDDMKPLICQTAAKIRSGAPADIQTGPAARGDIKVIEEHLAMLENHPEIRRIYSILTDSIIRKSKKNV